MPAPEALGAGDMVLYAAAAAVATWRSSAGILERISHRAITLMAAVSRTVDAVQKQLDRYLHIFARTQPAVLLVSERIYHLGESPRPPWNESSTLPSIPKYDYPTFLPLFVPPLPSVGSPDICSLPILGACAVGVDAQDPVVAHTVTPVPSHLDCYQPSIEPLETPHLPESPVAYVSPADLEGVAVGFHVPSQPTIIYVGPCLLALVAVCLFAFLCYVCIRLTVRLIARLVRFTYCGVRALLTSARDVTIRLSVVSRSIEAVKAILEDICGFLWSFVIGAGANYMPATELVTRVAPLAGVEEPSAVPPKRRNKKKKKSGKGPKVELPPTSSTLSSAPILPHSPTPETSGSQVPMLDKHPRDEGGEWTTVTRARKARRAPSPVPGDLPKSGLEGGGRRQ
ncbi:hypothetical protein FS749_003174 [Ceratobasidium sp. UAMH 11750]|nr:hypothetical protein FS749_003174 [Ceratobasidium sp. UAMH 11750]